MNYTSIEQSKHLLELGLNLETADMYYQAVLPRFSDKFHRVPEVGEPLHALEWYNKGYTKSGKKPLSLDEYCIPCWSVGALLDVLDYPKFYKDNTSGKDLWHCCCNINEREIIKASFAETEIDAVVELVTHLLEFGILKNKRNDESR